MSERVCQFFLRGRCQRAKCEFRHPAPSASASTEKVSDDKKSDSEAPEGVATDVDVGAGISAVEVKIKSCLQRRPSTFKLLSVLTNFFKPVNVAAKAHFHLPLFSRVN